MQMYVIISSIPNMTNNIKNILQKKIHKGNTFSLKKKNSQKCSYAYPPTDNCVFPSFRNINQDNRF